MIKVSVLYPNTSGVRFDMAYYLDRHMPMVRDLMGGALKGMNVEQGLAGGQPGVPAPYIALGHLFFESLDAFQAAFAQHSAPILADIPNYTNSQPTIQVSEVKL
ncbi:MAG TPA: EthD family reductase [Vicinamibacterales bacterium]|nr:EthD family reductase [Vicinamibacterales bacterium]